MKVDIKMFKRGFATALERGIGRDQYDLTFPRPYLLILKLQICPGAGVAAKKPERIFSGKVPRKIHFASAIQKNFRLRLGNGGRFRFRRERFRRKNGPTCILCASQQKFLPENFHLQHRTVFRTSLYTILYHEFA